MIRRREGRWSKGPLVASLLLHGAMVGLLALSGGGAPEPPKTKVYAVDIVSPPANVLGPAPTEALSNQEPGPAAAAPDPAPPAAAPPAAPEPDPPAPAPDPAPPPPREEAPKEPAKAPEPRRTPPQRPAPPAERPSTTPPRPATRPGTPAANPGRPAATPEKNRPAATRPGSGSGTQSGSGTGTNRTRGEGTSTAPATGANPQPDSPGGENLNIHVEGEPCPVAGYCERVTLQVQRYFRPPAGNAGARGEVCFRIQRDGTVSDIEARRVRGGGGAAFRLAMMEAAEAAGSRRAFGALPAAFDPQRWRWCVELTPR